MGETDPRFPAAFQRGGGSGPPVRRGADHLGRQGAPDPTRPESSPPADGSGSTDVIGAEPPAADGAEAGAGSGRGGTLGVPARVPAALAVSGAVCTALGAGVLWFESGAVWAGGRTETEEFLMTYLAAVPTPALTVGLLSLGAAAVAQIIRTSRP
ncbi:hypothetical protein GRS96_03690 [Rathayibacter sp. VKM Ac-2803]|uniref:hypothetical protein n=1 Tax=Rathayibacter sp. VKM Ac-2803 TaxID=2609256 RepID=UPI001359FFFF|nr:hypothetical protein [Rathayibacter sp. VKM Ac-2803]MWV48379.1 hypothetical protein [Rathayibacter sp. VKM Ac-2803]